MADARHSRDMGGYYVIEPEMEWWPEGDFGGEPLPDGFAYRSDTNTWWLNGDELRGMIGQLENHDASPDQG